MSAQRYKFFSELNFYPWTCLDDHTFEYGRYQNVITIDLRVQSEADTSPLQRVMDGGVDNVTVRMFRLDRVADSQRIELKVKCEFTPLSQSFTGNASYFQSVSSSL